MTATRRQPHPTFAYEILDDLSIKLTLFFEKLPDHGIARLFDGVQFFAKGSVLTPMLESLLEDYEHKAEQLDHKEGNFR
jgi:mitochondrial fission protein ELM1